MPEPLPPYKVRIQSLDATLADVRLEFDGLPAGTEVRGRLMGPRCPGASTIEIAYYLRPLGPGAYQVLIPEPSMWEPATPFTYQGPLEFWREGKLEGKTTITVGLHAAGR